MVRIINLYPEINGITRVVIVLTEDTIAGSIKLPHYLSMTMDRNIRNKCTSVPATFERDRLRRGYVRDFECPSVYGSDRPYPFFGKARITCPPRGTNLMTQRLGKKPRENHQPERHDGRTRLNGWWGVSTKLRGQSSTERRTLRVKYWRLNKILQPSCSDHNIEDSRYRPIGWT